MVVCLDRTVVADCDWIKVLKRIVTFADVE